MLKTEYSDTSAATNAASSPQPPSPSSSSSPPPPPPPPPLTSTTPPVVVSPCAACKILRRRCADKCVLAPYFPPTEPAKFTIAHRVFGASNITKFLQELPESQRADAVSSMVYEASARIRDPVYGCAGAICHLQKQVNELQAQLAKAQAELVNVQLQRANFLALLCMEMRQSEPNCGSGRLASDSDVAERSFRRHYGLFPEYPQPTSRDRMVKRGTSNGLASGSDVVERSLRRRCGLFPENPQPTRRDGEVKRRVWENENNNVRN